MRGENHFQVKGENTGQPEVIFRKISFSVTAKHTEKGENDFLKSFSPKTNAPLEKKMATAEPMIKSHSAENETLKNKVAILTVEAKNDKEHVAALEKSPQVEKDFSKLKDKKIGGLQFKLKKASPDVVQEFKESDLYSDNLCEYYVKGFELFRRWMAKHHL